MSLELISIHVPKTGGKSLKMIMCQAYGEDAIVHVRRKFYKRDPELVKKELLELITPEIKVLHGHFMHDEISFLKSYFPEAKWITFFREPVQRVISNYYWFQHRIVNERNITEKQRAYKDEPIVNFASRKGTQNKMTQFIGGMDLHKFFFIGTLEHYAEDINELSRLMQWEVDEIPHEHKNSDLSVNYKGHSNEEVAQIRAWNAEDVALYDRVLQVKKYK